MRTILFATAAALPLLLAVPAPAQSPTQEPYPPAGAQPTQPGTPQKPSTQQQQMPEGGPAGTTRQKTGETPMPQTTPGQKPGKAAQETMPRKQTPESGKTTTGKQAPGTETTGKAATGQETTGTVGLNADKRSRVRETIVRQHVQPIRDVNFNVRVGVAIPRTVELRTLPPEVIEIVPQYRSYRFFTLADGRIIIVDPDTFEIVYIIS